MLPDLQELRNDGWLLAHFLIPKTGHIGQPHYLELREPETGHSFIDDSGEHWHLSELLRRSTEREELERGPMSLVEVELTGHDLYARLVDVQTHLVGPTSEEVCEWLRQAMKMNSLWFIYRFGRTI